METTVCLQLAADLESGCEAAVQIMHDVYHSQKTNGVILVDGSSTFNSLNCQVALRNIQHQCPSIATFFINTYRIDIDLFIDWERIHSQEGITQGDSLGMAMYISLINQLTHSSIKQFGMQMMMPLVANYRICKLGGIVLHFWARTINTIQMLQRHGWLSNSIN